jgi:excisionase family DNA binding protein
MTDYNARLEFHTCKDVDELLIDRLADYHSATGRSPRGWVEVTITVPAESLRQAVSTALAVAEGAQVAPVLGVEVLPTAEFDARNGLAPMPELVSVTEAADLLGVSRQAVLQRLESGSLAGQKVGNTWIVQRGRLIRDERHEVATVE